MNANNGLPDSPVNRDNTELSDLLAKLDRGLISDVGGPIKGVGTLDRTKYHKATDDKRVMSGTIIPGSSADGRSFGFDAGRPTNVSIDPGEKGGNFSVDLKKLSSDEQNAAYNEAAKRYPSDVKARAVASYAIMAELVRRKEAGSTRPTLRNVVETNSPPKHTAIKQASVGRDSLLADVYSKYEDTGAQQMAQPGTPPKRRVEFELPKPFGRLTCFYHDVVRTGDLLILIYLKSSGATKWFPDPPSDDDEQFVDPQPIAVLVYDEYGEEDTVFAVIPTPVQFAYQGLEYCVLAIDAERSRRPQPEQPNALPEPFKA